MKTLFLYVFVACALLTASCKKTEKIYDATYIHDFEIQAGTAFYFQDDWVQITDRDFWLAKYGLKASDVTSVQVRFVRLTIFYTNDRFDWVDKGYLKIAKSDTNPAPNFFEIGFNLQVPQNQGSTLDLAPDLTELKDYFLANECKLQLKLLNKLNYVTAGALQVRLSLGLGIIVG